MPRAIAWGVVAFAVTVLAINAARGRPPATALTRLERGRWQLQEVGGPLRHTLCLDGPDALILLTAAGDHCALSVVREEAGSLTVHRACPGVGQGDSVLTIRTARLVRLAVQGVRRGAPFNADYEGRLVGACAGPP